MTAGAKPELEIVPAGAISPAHKEEHPVLVPDANLLVGQLLAGEHAIEHRCRRRRRDDE